MNNNYKLGLMEGHNDDDNDTNDDHDFDYYDEQIDWDEWE